MLTPGCTYVTGPDQKISQRLKSTAEIVYLLIFHLIKGQTMDVCGGLSLYNNYMKGYQNMDSLFEKMLADKAAKEAAGNSK